MGLPTQTQAQFVQGMIASWAAFLGFQPALEEGDPYLALMECVAAQAVFLQAIAQILNNVARAQTSTGADLDSFMAQFGFTRLPGSYATGEVTFSKFQPATSQVLIPAGTIVQTPGGAIQYEVIADPTQPTWSAALNAYVLAVNQSSLTATVEAVNIGTSSNVTANQLSQIATSLAGIDQVTNPAPITSGVNAESDPSFLARFVNWLNSLSKATYGAIVSAIQGVQIGLLYNILENVNTSGDQQFGEFVVVIDDGSGNPPSSLITAVYNAVYAVRGLTIMPQVIAVKTLAPSIEITVRNNGDQTNTQLEAAVQAAIVAYVNGLGIGGDTQGQTPATAGYLYIQGIASAAEGTAGVTSVEPNSITIDSEAADLAVDGFHRPLISASNVTVNFY